MSSVATDSPRLSPAAHEELALFHRTLAELCRAQVPLPQALVALRDQLRSGALREATDSMLAQVEAGTPLDEAYRAHLDRFPRIYAALVEAGMVSGDMPGMLEEIAQHADQRAQVLARLRRALAYPLFAACVVLTLGVVLAVVVMPSLWQMPHLVDFEGAPSHFLVGGIVLLGAVIFSTILLLAAGPFAGRRFVRVPVLGRMRDDVDRAGLAGSLAMLLRRQVPLATALRLAAATVSARRRDDVDRAAEDAEGGASFRDLAPRLFEPALAWLAGAADGSAQLPAALDEVARIHRSRFERAVDRLTTLVVPVLEILLGVVVFLLAMAYVLPLFQLGEWLYG
ncbi:MAG: type II secretion system F family protein [Planctomycetota bacterium]